MHRCIGLSLLALIALAACSSTSVDVDGIPQVSGASNNVGIPVTANSNAPPLGALTADAYQLGSFVSGFALDIQGDSNNGAPLAHAPQDGSANELWRFVAVAGTNAAYQIVNPASGKCIDVSRASVVSGAPLVTNTCAAVSTQQWSAAANGNLSFIFRNVNSGLCMAVQSANPNASTPVVQADCNGPATRWQVLSKTFVSGYGNVTFLTNPCNTITALSADLLVPNRPAATGALFLAPALAPVAQSASFQPIGGGELESVLSWGGSCAPGTQPATYTSWWISSQYISGGTYPGHTGCLGGEVMSVNVGDRLTIAMQLQGTVWTQTVTDTNTKQSVSYSLDMLGQAQTNVLLQMLPFSATPVADTVYENVQFTVSQPDTGFCVPATAGVNDFVGAGSVSADLRTCKIARVALRAQGVAATTPSK